MGNRFGTLDFYSITLAANTFDSKCSDLNILLSKPQMTNKDFLLQRICVYAGKQIDPCSDKEVESMLLRKFNIRLPQRSSMNDALASTISDHEILDLLIQYRTMTS